MHKDPTVIENVPFMHPAKAASKMGGKFIDAVCTIYPIFVYSSLVFKQS
jgi:hypothetical protein